MTTFAGRTVRDPIRQRFRRLRPAPRVIIQFGKAPVETAAALTCRFEGGR